MSLRNQGALIGAALGLFTRPLFAQNFDDGTDPFADKPASTEVHGKASLSSASATGAQSAGKPYEGHPRGLEAENSLNGSTGLLHTIAADSGATGTFRVSVLGSYYTGSGFLCPLCSTPEGKVLPRHDDDVSQIGTRFQLSATPADFLEAYASLRFQTTSNDQGTPKAIDIVGDTTLGVKAFLPRDPHRVFSFGGGADVTMLSSPGGVGLDGASVGLRLMGTADLTRQEASEKRVPLRIHLNVGYLFDGSGSLATSVEEDRANILGHKPRITRIERFGHDINRVDTFRTALGVEGVFPWVRPFAEWSIDVPVNRQGYDCGNTTNRSAGDGCLTNADFSALPSRATLGARVYPWAADWLEGLAFLAAFDIGTGAKSNFIEEVAPELPWALHIGLAYAGDTTPHGGPPRVVEKVVAVPAAPPVEHFIEGTVSHTGKGEPIGDAVVRYVGRRLTGMVSDELGKFQTGNLAPGDYRFAITADGFKDGECMATIPADPVAAKASKTPATPPTSAPVAAPAPVTPVGPVVVRLACELEALPRTATINGVLRDAETTMFVEGASVTITDPLGRQLSLKSDAEGTFRFGNVPAGKSKLTAEADGYLRAATEVTLEPRKDIPLELMIHKRPATPNVVITGTEIKLKKEVHFLHGSAEILPDSMALLEEAADVVRSHPEVGNIEIQGHTDDTGTPDVNQRLSTDRANAVRDVFVENGVDAARLAAHGYGQEKPLVSNTSPKNRAKNRRVQLVIVK